MDKNTPIEETMGALAEPIQEGKLRYVGLSEFNEEALRRAHKVHPVTAIEVEYSPWFLKIVKRMEYSRQRAKWVFRLSPISRYD
ncbi:NADP-dependent oxidoreductase domain-containing protein [Zychaea mexicana]|uniref:NADP-dependent oxidoreductase domain-containing protein n=1 Tax=Zychaea mexicana TaxID=64656 RepID=UPI0022FE4F1A|nr:NADP-dependent oxidoreductase domain-containing protein [Zychaea mexicana]KAI9498751.1 NADP-dependent oxidoreductase domain-containing protein [Zychaea mexicana]